MLMGSYETMNEKYNEGIEGFDGGLGFSFRKALKRVRKAATKIRQAPLKLQKRAIQRTSKLIRKSPGFKLHQRFARTGMKLARRSPGFKLHQRFARTGMKLARRSPGFKLARRFGRSRGLRRLATATALGPMAPLMASPKARQIFSNSAKRLTQKVLNAPARLLPEIKAPGRKNFLRWLKNVDPAIYQKVMTKVEANRRMMGQTISGLDLEGVSLEGGMSGLWDDIKGTLTDVISTGVTMAQQRDLYKLQLARAEKGLPPLDASQVAPTIKTQVEIGPETRAEMFSEIGGGLKKFALPLAIGAGALYFMSRK